MHRHEQIAYIMEDSGMSLEQILDFFDETQSQECSRGTGVAVSLVLLVIFCAGIITLL